MIDDIWRKISREWNVTLDPPPYLADGGVEAEEVHAHMNLLRCRTYDQYAQRTRRSPIIKDVPYPFADGCTSDSPWQAEDGWVIDHYEAVEHPEVVIDGKHETTETQLAWSAVAFYSSRRDEIDPLAPMSIDYLPVNTPEIALDVRQCSGGGEVRPDRSFPSVTHYDDTRSTNPDIGLPAFHRRALEKALPGLRAMAMSIARSYDGCDGEDVLHAAVAELWRDRYKLPCPVGRRWLTHPMPVSQQVLSMLRRDGRQAMVDYLRKERFVVRKRDTSVDHYLLLSLEDIPAECLPPLSLDGLHATAGDEFEPSVLGREEPGYELVEWSDTFGFKVSIDPCSPPSQSTTGLHNQVARAAIDQHSNAIAYEFLRVVEGYRDEDIAELAGKSVSATQGARSRARKQLFSLEFTNLVG